MIELSLKSLNGVLQISEWVNCTGINGAKILVNLENVPTITNYGAGTRLALSGNSQTYVDIAEGPAEVIALPRMGKDFDSTSSRSYSQESDFGDAPNS